MLFDSHAHLNFKLFDQDRSEVVARCQALGMAVVNVGSQVPTSRVAIKLAQENKNFFASVAIHPIHIGDNKHDPVEDEEHRQMKPLPEAFEEITELSADSKVVAIGETGLDFFHLTEGREEETKKLQEEYFQRHIELAKERNLPLIVHGRDQDISWPAYRRILEILRRANTSNGVIHCFGADEEIAKQFLDLGFYIGFTGIITFKKKAEALQDLVKSIPLDRILIETDCPYLAPEPYRGERNEPAYVRYVAEKIAELKNLSVEEVIATTGANAARLFKVNL